MNTNINKVTKLREKIFKTKKYDVFNETINKMIVPKKFDYNNCIPIVFSETNYEDINHFTYGEYHKLYERILKDLVNDSLKDNPIIVVHPFYTLIRHANFLATDEKYLETYLEYENKLIKLLKTANNDIILLESPDSFAKYTYSFLKYGKIKKVILTCHSSGKLLNEKDLENLNITKATICGCYGKHCIKDVEKQLANIEIKRIDDLIMERFI